MDDKTDRVEVKLKTTRTRNPKAGSLPAQVAESEISNIGTGAPSPHDQASEPWLKDR
jgi:hypothetical protein